MAFRNYSTCFVQLMIKKTVQVHIVHLTDAFGTTKYQWHASAAILILTFLLLSLSPDPDTYILALGYFLSSTHVFRLLAQKFPLGLSFPMYWLTIVISYQEIIWDPVVPDTVWEPVIKMYVCKHK
jgi:hypothetical protein